MATKMTKKDNYSAIRTILEELHNDELIAFIDHEIELLDKRNSSKTGKMTKTQIENVGIKAKILEVLNTSDKPMTATEVMKSIGGDYSLNKISALLTQMADKDKDNTVERTEVKGKAYFTAIATDVE